MTPEEERARMVARMRCDGKEEDLTPAEARERMIARMRGDEWEESEHPRDEGGRFTSGSRESKASETEGGVNASRREPKGGAPLKFVKTNPSKFNAALKAAKETRPPEERWRVDDTHSEEDYKNAKLFQTKNGSVGAVEKNGNIIMAIS